MCGLLHENLLALMDVDAGSGGSLAGDTHQVVVQVVLFCSLNLLDCRGIIAVSRHEDDQTFAGVVHLVEDDLLDVLSSLLSHVPSVALSPDSASAVVEQVIKHAAVTVVHKGVVARIIVLGLGIFDLAQVDVGSTGGHSDAPQAAFHPVALHVNVGATAAVIDAVMPLRLSAM